MRFLWKEVSSAESECCTSGPPEGDFRYGASFSSSVCGAWSVAKTSI